MAPQSGERVTVAPPEPASQVQNGMERARRARKVQAAADVVLRRAWRYDLEGLSVPVGR